MFQLFAYQLKFLNDYDWLFKSYSTELQYWAWRGEACYSSWQLQAFIVIDEVQHYLYIV